MTDRSLIEKTINSENVFSGKLLNVFNDGIELPDGNKASREYIKHVGAVCVVALTDDNKVIVERQYRYPMHEITLEIPAGKLDSKDEDPLEAAKRELREETGALADRMTYLGKFYPTPAYSDEVIHMYLAEGLSFGDQSLDDDEFLTIDLVPISELADRILEGDIPDGKTQAAILAVCRKLGL
ncbi:MAG: NUDIX hydrolase [Clostridia bacterium]|nr:NUDIX hydrolase [Clostridia bacterium]